MHWMAWSNHLISHIFTATWKRSSASAASRKINHINSNRYTDKVKREKKICFISAVLMAQLRPNLGLFECIPFCKSLLNMKIFFAFNTVNKLCFAVLAFLCSDKRIFHENKRWKVESWNKTFFFTECVHFACRQSFSFFILFCFFFSSGNRLSWKSYIKRYTQT